MADHVAGYSGWLRSSLATVSPRTTYIRSGTNGIRHRFSYPLVTYQPPCGIFLFQQSQFVRRWKWRRHFLVTQQRTERKTWQPKSKHQSLTHQINPKSSNILSIVSMLNLSSRYTSCVHYCHWMLLPWILCHMYPVKKTCWLTFVTWCSCNTFTSLHSTICCMFRQYFAIVKESITTKCLLYR